MSRIGARPVWFREIVARHEAFPADAVLLRVAQSIWRRTGPPNASSAATDDAFAVKVDVSKPCKSLGDFVDMFRELHLSGNKTVTTQEERCFLWQIGNLEYACGTALSNLSIKHWDVDSCAGLSTEQSLVRGGSDKILKPLVDKVGDVRLKFEVTRVEWDASTGRVEGSLPCIVHRADGPPVGADAVVVTLPLGVLKARAVAFDPPLPEEKAAAIGRLGFGNVAKIVLSFEKRFWAPAMGAKRRIGRLPGKAPDGPGIFFEFADVTDATNAPTIVASCGGTFADMMSKELITDERVAETFANSAHIMFKNLCQGCDTPEKPLAWATASWGTDRHFHGCYTYMGLDSSPADVEALRKPLRDGGGNTRLFFAGEATDSRFLASTEGAMRSGIRAADAVAKSLLSSKSYAAWKEVHATPMSDTDSDSEESDADDDGGEEKGSILSLDENHLTSSRVGEEFQVAAPPPSPLAAAAPLKKETQMHVLQQWLESEGIAAPETEAADARWRASPGESSSRISSPVSFSTRGEACRMRQRCGRGSGNATARSSSYAGVLQAQIWIPYLLLSICISSLLNVIPHPYGEGARTRQGTWQTRRMIPKGLFFHPRTFRNFRNPNRGPRRRPGSPRRAWVARGACAALFHRRRAA